MHPDFGRCVIFWRQDVKQILSFPIDTRLGLLKSHSDLGGALQTWRWGIQINTFLLASRNTFWSANPFLSNSKCIRLVSKCKSRLEMSQLNHSYYFSHIILGCLGYFLSVWLPVWLCPVCLEERPFMSETLTSVLSGATGGGLRCLLYHSVTVSIPWVPSALWLHQLDRNKEHLLCFSSHNLLPPSWAHSKGCWANFREDPATAQVTEQSRALSFLHMVLYGWTHSRATWWSNIRVGEWKILCWNCDHLLLLIWTKGFVRLIIKEL